VLFETTSFSLDDLKEGKRHFGTVTLNRPKALNALNKDMAIDIHKQLVKWEIDPYALPYGGKTQLNSEYFFQQIYWRI